MLRKLELNEIAGRVSKKARNSLVTSVGWLLLAAIWVCRSQGRFENLKQVSSVVQNEKFGELTSVQR